MEADILLVKMVEKNPCLYNKKKSEYRDDDLKEMIWSTIASALQTQGNMVGRSVCVCMHAATDGA